MNFCVSFKKDRREVKGQCIKTTTAATRDSEKHLVLWAIQASSHSTNAQAWVLCLTGIVFNTCRGTFLIKNFHPLLHRIFTHFILHSKVWRLYSVAADVFLGLLYMQNIVTLHCIFDRPFFVALKKIINNFYCSLLQVCRSNGKIASREWTY